jgi:hypothetical protein
MRDVDAPRKSLERRKQIGTALRAHDLQRLVRRACGGGRPDRGERIGGASAWPVIATAQHLSARGNDDPAYDLRQARRSPRSATGGASRPSCEQQQQRSGPPSRRRMLRPPVPRGQPWLSLRPLPFVACAHLWITYGFCTSVGQPSNSPGLPAGDGRFVQTRPCSRGAVALSSRGGAGDDRRGERCGNGVPPIPGEAACEPLRDDRPVPGVPAKCRALRIAVPPPHCPRPDVMRVCALVPGDVMAAPQAPAQPVVVRPRRRLDLSMTHMCGSRRGGGLTHAGRLVPHT